MIVDRLEEMRKYADRIPNLEAALQYFNEHPQMPEGKNLFPGGSVVLQTGMTKPADDGLFEAHKRYLDMQVLISGREYIQWNALSQMEKAVPYDEEKDVARFSGEGALLEMRPGMCCVLFPEDAHKGCRHPMDAAPGEYEKLVFKLEI